MKYTGVVYMFDNIEDIKSRAKKLSWFLFCIFGKIADELIEHIWPDSKFNAFLDKTISLQVSITIGEIIFYRLLFIPVIVFTIDITNSYLIKRAIKKHNSYNDSIKTLLDKTILENEYIDSMQAYKYKTKSVKEGKYIKISFLSGSADERIDINSILQAYYYIPHSISKKMDNFSNTYVLYNNDLNPKYRDSLINDGIKICGEILSSLNNLNDVNNIGMYHFEMYRIYMRVASCLTDILSQHEQSTVSYAISKTLQNEEIQNYLETHKRTGILGSILLNGIYIFYNKNSKIKANRIYFTSLLDEKNKVIVLGSMPIDPFLDEESKTIEEKRIDEYCRNIIDNLKLT